MVPLVLSLLSGKFRHPSVSACLCLGMWCRHRTQEARCCLSSVLGLGGNTQQGQSMCVERSVRLEGLPNVLTELLDQS